MQPSIHTEVIRPQIIRHRRKRLLHRGLLLLALIVITDILFNVANTPITPATNTSATTLPALLPIMAFKDGADGYLRVEDIHTSEPGADPRIGIGTLASPIARAPYLVPFHIQNDTILITEPDFLNYVTGRSIRIVPHQSLADMPGPPPLPESTVALQGVSQP